ncbi:HCP-like protein [Backusella circina FSU 941]|nr:HCP-like protein [Backusella circina FSU 941]
MKEDGIAVDSTIIKKANNGNCSALFTIGYEYHNTRKEYDKAMAWHLLSAEKNYYLAQNNIGRLYSDGLGVPIDYDIAMGWFLKAAKQKNETAFKNIGLSFEKGEGKYDKPENYFKRIAWYHLAAAKNHPEAFNDIGSMYHNGEGVSLDYGLSIDWFLEAAKKNEKTSCSNIGLMFERGQGIAVNKMMALEWYHKAAEKNLARAKSDIGSMYARGQGVAKDDLTALDWYLKAAKQEYTPAFNQIALVFHYGRGIPLDIHKAKEWFYKAGEYDTDYEASDDESNLKLTDAQKQKPLEDMIREAEFFLVLGRLEEDKKQLSQEIIELREVQTTMQKDIEVENERERLLQAENKSLLDEIRKERHEASTRIISLGERVKQLLALLHNQKSDIKNKEL